jgi:eukaryotic-like serine/threonine-protein kinase
VPPAGRGDYTRIMHPTQLGPYDLSALLGRGGMGAVYAGVDRGTGREVAVKTLATHLGDDPGLRRRFAGEIETLKSLRHPCIVELLAFGEEDGQPYFAMELVRGRSLEQVLRSGRRFTWRETVEVALGVTRALKSAHDHGVVHRDLKPANLLFPDAPTGDATVKLADFGIARLFGSAGHTLDGMIVGTADYMAPEQAVGGAVDHRVDLYALGLVMFAMLAGRPPFHGGHVTEVLKRQRNEVAPRVSSRVADVPPELDDLIDRLLAKDPAKRPASALAVGRQLAVIATTAGVPPDAGAADADLVVDPGLTLGQSGAATDCEESRRGTAAGTGGAAGDAVDFDAPTQDFARGETSPPDPAVIPGNRAGEITADDPTMPMPTKPAPASGIAGAPTGLPKRATVPAHDGAQAPVTRTTRFTTVEELDRVSRTEAAARERRDLVIRFVAALGLVAVVAGLGYALLRPPTADELHAQIRVIADDATADLRDARPLIERFLAEHGADPRAAGVRKLDRQLDLDSLEKRARRRRDDDDPALTPLEREYRAAMAREDESPLACAAALAAILALHADEATAPPAADAPPESQPGLWLDLVRRQLARVEPLADREREQDVDRAAETLAEAADLAADAAVATDDAARDALLSRRRALLTGVVEIYASRPHVAAAVAEARRLLATPESTP